MFLLFRLTSVAGLSYIFSDEERDASWCGSPGRPCLDCRGASDVSIFDQCADRIMCPILAEKLFELLKKLQDCLDENSKCDHRYGVIFAVTELSFQLSVS